MIRIVKPAEPPEVLWKQGAKRRGTHCANYTKFAADYDSGAKTFSFDDDIYAASSVKDKLIEAQHGKCCYCEKIIDNDGDVEHFRPSAGYCQDEKSLLVRPGYYWLAYDWDNLLYSCHVCNQRHKRSLFPLTDPAKRARTHRDDVSNEDPILLHPCHVDPEKLIRFDLYTPVAVGGSRQGEQTIKLLGLERKSLRNRRLAHLKQLALLRNIVDIMPNTDEERQTINEARQFLAEAVTNAAEFASMARCAAEKDFPYLSEQDDEQE